MDSASPQRPSHTRNRSKSTFSFKSSKSDKSDPTRPRPEINDLLESPSQKSKSKFAIQTVRDPNKAIREAQPSERQDEASTMPRLRSTQYKDWKGDSITDPDSSNPTRPRLERPLDTIRSFEAAFDSSWKRRSNLPRSDSAEQTSYSSRRNSYVSGNETPYSHRQSTPVNGYNGSRNPYRYSDHHAQRPGNPRYQSSPMAPNAAPNGNGWASHPAHGYSQSYDTVDTGGSYGTSGSEPWGNSTDPSSENSSLERMYGANGMNGMNGMNGTNGMNGANGYKPDYGDPYGGQYRRESPRHDPIQEEYGFDGNGYTQGQWTGPSAAPPPPRHSTQNAPPRSNGYAMGPPPPAHHHQPRNVIPLSGGNAPIPPPSGPAPPRHNSQPQQKGSVLRKESKSGEGKRKSWLRRRFSKSGS